jgi:hypothetical protein
MRASDWLGLRRICLSDSAGHLHIGKKENGKKGVFLEARCDIMETDGCL